MLAKLVKYDLKYGCRIFIILQAILMTGCILGRFFFMDRLDYSSDTNALISLFGVFTATFTMLFLGVGFGVFFLIAVRFYKNLFTDEGYLAWTVPATPTQQLWAKIISGIIWYTLSTVVECLAILVLVTGENTITAYAKVSAEVTEALGMPITQFSGYLLLFSSACIIGSIVMIYLSIAIGQLVPAHRVLCSIIAYFSISVITQILSLLLMVIFNIFPTFGTMSGRTELAAAEYVLALFKLSLGLSMFMAIIGYLILHYILYRKVNLC